MRGRSRSRPEVSDSSSDGDSIFRADRPRRVRRRGRQARFVPGPTIAMNPAVPERFAFASQAWFKTPDPCLGHGFPILQTVGQEVPPGPFNILPRGIGHGCNP
jgi:hypothetical protein